MTKEEDFRVRPGRARSRAGQRTRPFIAQALAAAQKAGGYKSRAGRIVSPRASHFGRGRVASIHAKHLLHNRSRITVIKARVVRHGGGAPLALHLDYLARDGVTRYGEKGHLFGATRDDLDAKEFAERCAEDRHHFRFIVAPDNALEMADLKTFTRDLMHQIQKDLGTKLDWGAIDHCNTGHPHIHILVRGKTDEGENLVIARDYIREGMRARASLLITQELGPRTDHDILNTLTKQIEVERWTPLDRELQRDAARDPRDIGVIDLTPPKHRAPDMLDSFKIGRLRKLERLDLAHELSPGRWSMSSEAEPVLRELGSRDDIIKRMHHALKADGIERNATNYLIGPALASRPVIGRLVARGLDDELAGSAYAIIDGVDGRTHHITLPDLSAAGDSRPGSIVELRHYEDRKGKARLALAIRSDMDLQTQITASGATWLDRVNLGSKSDLGEGFGREVRIASDARADQLVARGLARRQNQRMIFARNLLETLKSRDVEGEIATLEQKTGLVHQPPKPGHYVTGKVRERLTLSSGRFALIETVALDGGFGFALVPWTPSLDGQLGKHISGIMRGDGGVDWNLGRSRGIGR